ncbi:hypothetical protein V8E54_006600 [Elaphomyces granulatus]
MAHAHQFVAAFLRVSELICAAIVVGIISRYEYFIHTANAPNSGRLVYSLVIGCISIIVSIFLMIPFHATFYLFPIDLVLFICWMVAFGLMANLTASGGCSSFWFWHSWSYYWGGWWYTVPITDANSGLIGTASCGEWRSNLAFSFISSIIWLFSGILGLYAILEYGNRNQGESGGHRPKHWKKGHKDTATTSPDNQAATQKSEPVGEPC